MARLRVAVIGAGFMGEHRTVLVDTAGAPAVQGHPGGMFYYEIRHFLDCIRQDTPPAITHDDAVMALRIALAVERAAATGQSVRP